MLNKLKHYFRLWADKRNREQGTILLNQRRIYILPTRQGLVFACVLLLMLLGDINYNLSLGYALTFLLATAAAMTMLHAFRNMTQLEIRAGRCHPVFAGETAAFVLHFHNRSPLPRYQLTLHDSAGHRTTFDLPAQQDTAVQLPVAAARRGWLECGRLALYTEFPLGLFRAWSYLHFDIRCLVYPAPIATAALPASSIHSGSTQSSGSGDEDFAGLRDYVAGDAQQRIAWKALAREQGLQVKQFSAAYGQSLWLDWSLLPAVDHETKLSILTRWVLDAEAAGLRYGLRLPGAELALDSSSAHREDCLKTLALYGNPQASSALAAAPRRRNWLPKFMRGKQA